MVRKGIITLMIIGLISMGYILGLEIYTSVPNTITKLSHKINMQDESNDSQEAMVDIAQEPNLNITYNEIGVSLSGIVYDETLSEAELVQRAQKLIEALSHDENCSLICDQPHHQEASIQTKSLNNGIETKVEGCNLDIQYTCIIRNQKQIHENSYYELRIVGKDHVGLMDQMVERVKRIFRGWGLRPTPTIYFKGDRTGEMTGLEMQTLTNALFENLEAVQTNYYQDEKIKTTCSYYAYCPYIETYYKEANGHKTNTQCAFHYDELKDRTQIIIAFPFYNGLF